MTNLPVISKLRGILSSVILSGGHATTNATAAASIAGAGSVTGRAKQDPAGEGGSGYPRRLQVLLIDCTINRLYSLYTIRYP
jgi:hypothetical protein